MKDIKKRNVVRYLTAVSLTVAIFVSSSMFVLAVPNSPVGEIVVSGRGEFGAEPSVKVNGERALSGRTFFSSSLIETTETTFADINLGKLGRISLSPNTILSLSFTENSIAGKLSAGKIKVFSAQGISVTIETPDDTVFSDAALPGNFTVDVQSGTSLATAESGSIRMNNGRQVVPGQTTTSDEGGLLLPLSIFAGAVGAAVISVILNNREDDDDDGISPIR